MAEKPKEKVQHVIRGRRTASEPEVEIGRADSLDDARGQAEETIQAGGWHLLAVYDPQERCVYTAGPEVAGKTPDRGDDPYPAA